MAKKSKAVEKETRRLMEGFSDLVKEKNGRFKFKTGKKKTINRMKKTCVHWTMKKGEPYPMVKRDPTNPNNWVCTLCEARFPVAPLTPEEYNQTVDALLAQVNQLMFLSIKMGGNSDDTKMFLKLKEMLPRLKKVQKNLIKALVKRQQFEDRRVQSDSMHQFGGSTWNYQ